MFYSVLFFFCSNSCYCFEWYFLIVNWIIFLCHCLRLLFAIFFLVGWLLVASFKWWTSSFMTRAASFQCFFPHILLFFFCSANSSFVGPRVASVCALGLLLHSCCNHSCICCTNTHTVAFAAVVSLVKRFQLMLVLVLPSLISGH